MRRKRSTPGREIAGAANLRLQAADIIATLFVKVLDGPFWRAAQWRGRLADQITNEEGNR